MITLKALEKLLKNYDLIQQKVKSLGFSDLHFYQPLYEEDARKLSFYVIKDDVPHSQEDENLVEFVSDTLKMDDDKIEMGIVNTHKKYILEEGIQAPFSDKEKFASYFIRNIIPFSQDPENTQDVSEEKLRKSLNYVFSTDTRRHESTTFSSTHNTQEHRESSKRKSSEPLIPDSKSSSQPSNRSKKKAKLDTPDTGADSPTRDQERILSAVGLSGEELLKLLPEERKEAIEHMEALVRIAKNLKFRQQQSNLSEPMHQQPKTPSPETSPKGSTRQLQQSTIQIGGNSSRDG